MAQTKVPGQRIAAGAITNDKVAAGAGIALSKLENGAKLILNDGSVVMVAALKMGGFNFDTLGAATQAGQAVEYNQFQNALAALSTMFTPKNAVTVAAPANINLAAPGANIDGRAMALNDRFLAYSQTAPAENGIYLWKGAGVAAVRADDFNEWSEIPGTTIPVLMGTVNADVIFLSTADPGGTLGTTAITFIKVGVTAGLQYSNFIVGETPSGAINGTNVVFTLANTPQLNKEEIFHGGVKLTRGGGNDYTISGAVVTMLEAPTEGTITANYII